MWSPTIAHTPHSPGIHFQNQGEFPYLLYSVPPPAPFIFILLCLEETPPTKNQPPEAISSPAPLTTSPPLLPSHTPCLLFLERVRHSPALGPPRLLPLCWQPCPSASDGQVPHLLQGSVYHVHPLPVLFTLLHFSTFAFFHNTYLIYLIYYGVLLIICLFRGKPYEVRDLCFVTDASYVPRTVPDIRGHSINIFF